MVTSTVAPGTMSVSAGRRRSVSSLSSIGITTSILGKVAERLTLGSACGDFDRRGMVTKDSKKMSYHHTNSEQMNTRLGVKQ